MALWKEELLDRVDLEPLPDVTIEQIVTGFLGGPVSGSLVASLARRSRGNMLFVRELVLGALAQGALRNDGGLWHLVGRLHPSHRLVELDETRLAEADPEERAALEPLALGEPLADTELESFVADEVADRLEERGLISTSLVEGRFHAALAHPMYGDVLREQLSAGRVRRLTRRLAEMAEAAEPHRPDDLLRIGSWRLRCGGGRPDVLLGAARVAFERVDYPLAGELADATVGAGAGFDAELLVAEIMTKQGGAAGAETILERLWADAADDSQRTRVSRYCPPGQPGTTQETG